MKEATMLYKKGTALKTNEGEFDYIIVDADEVADYLKKGWFKTQQEALKPTKRAIKNELD